MTFLKKVKYGALSVMMMASTWFCGNAPVVKDDEEVIFFPTCAHLDKEGKNWIIPIHGWIFEPEEDSIRRNLLLHALDDPIAGDDEVKKKRFRERARLFLVDNQRAKRMVISLGDRSFTMRLSGANGHFYGVARLPAAELMGQSIVRFFALRVSGDRKFEGIAHLVSPGGVTVVSDIDDTIKDSRVLDTKETLRRTFLEEFEAVEGMAAVYNKWRKQGAAFHYVSSSPWQLYSLLALFFEKETFPPGSFHLKLVRLKDSTLFNLFKSSLKTKVPVIEELITYYPGHQFILVGDSGEHDPEVYGVIGRKFPANVRHIFIRDVTPGTDQTERFEKAFKKIPPDRWTVFTNPGDLEKMALHD